jgi:hypothetical protein
MTLDSLEKNKIEIISDKAPTVFWYKNYLRGIYI